MISSLVPALISAFKARRELALESVTVVSKNTNELKTLAPPWPGRKHRHFSCGFMVYFKRAEFWHRTGENDEGDAVILKLDKKEYRAILGEIESRTEVELVREETK